MRLRAFCSSATVVLLTMVAPASATQVGQILVCYACQHTGNAAIDAALAVNPGVASDGILFAFENTSSTAITGGVFSENGSPADSFALPSIAAGSTFILVPGVTSDGGVHPSAGLFAADGVKDTSDGAGGLTDSTMFKFVGFDNSAIVTSMTAGTSTAVPGTFTSGDPGLFKPFRDNPAAGTTSFIGQGPSGDGGCSNCYFGVVATLDTPGATSTPEPGTAASLIVGLGLMLSAVYLGIRRKQLE